jgi:hypothetical protein
LGLYFIPQIEALSFTLNCWMSRIWKARPRLTRLNIFEFWESEMASWSFGKKDGFVGIVFGL